MQDNEKEVPLRKKPYTEAELQLWLVSQLADLLEIRPEKIDVRQPFASFGLDSVAAVSLTGDLGDKMGLNLPATLFWDYPTIESLARHIARECRHAQLTLSAMTQEEMR